MIVTDKTMALAQDILDYWNFSGKHNQSHWFAPVSNLKVEPVVLSTGKEVNVCNTTMCAAGTAVFLDNPKGFVEVTNNMQYDDDWWIEQGADLLGLDEDEANRMFYSSNDSAKALMTAIANGSQSEFDAVPVLAL